jgi:hypothetical protein
MAGFFKELRKRVFGTSKDTAANEFAAIAPDSHGGAKTATPPTNYGAKPVGRDPYFVQIGFDFGTAYSKCVCRDVNLDSAWVYLPNEDIEMPFLIPSAVRFDGVNFARIDGSEGSYRANTLHHIKMVLDKVAREQWNDPVLTPYREAAPDESQQVVRSFVESCAVFFLGSTLGRIREEIRSRFVGEVNGDYIAVNMAVPVANADHPTVNALFDKMLRTSWVVSDELRGCSAAGLEKIQDLIASSNKQANSASTKEACFIYPEVSANVQGFVRSRTSGEGLYLFSDTGAGTVDQSVFLFARPEGQNLLTYLHANVLPLGSSKLEYLAAQRNGGLTWDNLERWRSAKERGKDIAELRDARDEIRGLLHDGSTSTICIAKKKLNVPTQINRMRVIFGGGGDCDYPYRQAVIAQFDGNLFRADRIEARRSNQDSFELGMPIPSKEEFPLTASQHRWMNRLTVAYGLSFEKGDLASFTLPQDVDFPPEEEIWKPKSPRGPAPSKDEV